MTIMVDMSRYSSKPPEMLLTHPCRTAVWRMRAAVPVRCRVKSAAVL